jgi:hypothetical protein
MGIIATIKIMKGTDLKILIMLFMILKTTRFSSRCPFLVTTSNIPSGSPITAENSNENATI